LGVVQAAGNNPGKSDKFRKRRNFPEEPEFVGVRPLADPCSLPGRTYRLQAYASAQLTFAYIYIYIVH